MKLAIRQYGTIPLAERNKYLVPILGGCAEGKTKLGGQHSDDAVGDSVQLASRRDAHDPERTVSALLLLAAGVSELQPTLDGFLRRPVELALG